jgi:hypothetical protein
MTILAHTLAADHLVRVTFHVRSRGIVGHEAHKRACHGRTLRNDTVAGSVAGTPAVDEVARIEEVDDA